MEEGTSRISLQIPGGKRLRSHVSSEHHEDALHERDALRKRMLKGSISAAEVEARWRVLVAKYAPECSESESEEAD